MLVSIMQQSESTMHIHISPLPHFQISVSNSGRNSSFIHTLKIFQNLNKVTDGFNGSCINRPVPTSALFPKILPSCLHTLDGLYSDFQKMASSLLPCGL